MQQWIVDQIQNTGIVAIIRGLESAYEPVVQAMYNGGVRAVEVTFNQKYPERFFETCDAIRTIRNAMGDQMAVGAGTVTSPELVEMAFEAGAQFIVSPDTNPAVIRRTKELGMVSIPGAMTPTEILAAHNAGADFVKLFPVDILGLAYIKSVRAPLNHIRLLAVGGIGESNAAAFIKAGCTGIAIGGNLVNKDWIAAGEYDKIEAYAAQLCRNIRQAR